MPHVGAYTPCGSLRPCGSLYPILSPLASRTITTEDPPLHPKGPHPTLPSQTIIEETLERITADTRYLGNLDVCPWFGDCLFRIYWTSPLSVLAH